MAIFYFYLTISLQVVLKFSNNKQRTETKWHLGSLWLIAQGSLNFIRQDPSIEKGAAKFEPNVNFRFLNVFYFTLKLYQINRELLLY